MSLFIVNVMSLVNVLTNAMTSDLLWLVVLMACDFKILSHVIINLTKG